MQNIDINVLLTSEDDQDYGEDICVSVNGIDTPISHERADELARGAADAVMAYLTSQFPDDRYPNVRVNMTH